MHTCMHNRVCQHRGAAHICSTGLSWCMCCVQCDHAFAPPRQKVSSQCLIWCERRAAPEVRTQKGMLAFAVPCMHCSACMTCRRLGHAGTSLAAAPRHHHPHPAPPRRCRARHPLPRAPRGRKPPALSCPRHIRVRPALHTLLSIDVPAGMRPLLYKLAAQIAMPPPMHMLMHAAALFGPNRNATMHAASQALDLASRCVHALCECALVYTHARPQVYVVLRHPERPAARRAGGRRLLMAAAAAAGGGGIRPSRRWARTSTTGSRRPLTSSPSGCTSPRERAGKSRRRGVN